MVRVYDVCLVALLSALLFSVEQALSFLPNIQITFLLIFVYSKTIKTPKTLIVILIHVILDNLVHGSLSIVFLWPMLLGYSIIPITLNTIFKKVNNIIFLSLLGVMYSLIYCYLFLIITTLMLNVKILDYLIADIVFQLLLCGSTFVSILWLYAPLQSRLKILLLNKENQDTI